MRNHPLLAGTLALIAYATAASAAPTTTPFLQVDINGDNGATHPGWTGWAFDDSINPATPYSNTFGAVGVTITGTGVGMDSLDRGNPPPADPNGDVWQDAIYTTRDTSLGLGRHYLQFGFTGLLPNTQYEFTFLAYDPNNSGSDGFMAWGTSNPADFPNYQPRNEAGGSVAPAPHVRSPITGPWPSNTADPTYFYSASLLVTTNGAGAATIYGWNDANLYSSQTVSIVNGFAIGLVPEPASLGLLALGGLTTLTRRRA